MNKKFFMGTVNVRIIIKHFYTHIFVFPYYEVLKNKTCLLLRGEKYKQDVILGHVKVQYYCNKINIQMKIQVNLKNCLFRYKF